MQKNYNNSIYEMYEEEYNKNQILEKEINKLKLENSTLKYELKYIKKTAEDRIKKEINKVTDKLIKEKDILQIQLDNTLEEIKRLKNQINESKEDKDYLIDKLNNQINKNSSNSSIPTSKEIKPRINTYNHRKNNSGKSGGQVNHKGSTLTRKKLEEKINQNHIEVREVKHYIKGTSKGEVIKYKIGIETTIYVEKHIFIRAKNGKEKLPKSFYSDVTYKEDLKMLVVALGNYFSIPYNKIKELLFDLTNGIIDISEGTIDNIYEEFTNKTNETLTNITKRFLSTHR